MNSKYFIRLMAFVALLHVAIQARAAAPTIAAISNQVTVIDVVNMDGILPIHLNVGDAETPNSGLQLSLTTTDPELVPPENVRFQFFVDQTWFLTMAPGFGKTGVATNTVTVSDGTNTASTSFVFTVNPPPSGFARYANTNAIQIPNNTNSSPYPSTINVAGMSGTVTNLTLTVSQLYHQFTRDLHMLLVAPSGKSVVIWSRSGGDFVTNTTVTVTDNCEFELPGDFAIWMEQLKPAAHAPPTNFPAPAPAGPYTNPVAMATFNGEAANGNWSLYVHDAAQALSPGFIAGGWSLLVATTGGTTGPSISDITNKTTLVNTPTAAIPFTISSPVTETSNLVLSVSSSNPTLVPTNNIVLGGSGSNRSLTITPTSNQIGSATITVTVADGPLSASDTFVLAVNPAPLTINENSFTRGYGLTNPVLTGSIVGLQAGDNITAAFAAAANTNSPVGVYPITFTLSDPGSKLGNYTVTTNHGTLTVTNAPLFVTANSSNKIYGATRTFAGTEFTITGGTLYNGNTLTNVALASTGTNAAATVGSYPITATNAVGAGLSNYLVSYVSGALSVNVASLLIAAENTNKIYGATLLPSAFTATGLMNGDTLTNVSFASSGSVSNAPVGAHVITPSAALGIGLTNYSISYSNGTLTVGAANLLITAASTNKIYGTALNPSDYTVAGLLNSDAVTNVTLASAGSGTNAPVGSYPISAGVALGTGLTNYAIGYSNGTMTVTQAGLVVTTHDTNKVYGTTLNPVAYTVTGLLNGDTVTNAVLASAGSVTNAPVGTHPITATVEGTGLTNYAIGYSNGTMTVSTANLLITAADTNKVYGTTLNPTGYMVAGLLNSDSVTNVTFTSTGSAGGAFIGSHTIGASGALGTGLTNYAIGYSNGTMTVTQAGLVVTTHDTNKVYGTTLNPVAYTVTGLLNGDTVTNAVLASAGSVTNAPVGTHPITATVEGTGLTNYAIGYSNGTMVVNVASLLVTTHDTNKIYGVSLQPVAYTVTGLLNSDSVTNAILSAAGSETNAPVGGYPITATVEGTGLTNYAIGYSNGTMVVNVAGLLVTPHDTNKIYGTTLDPAAYTVTGLLNSDTVTNATLTSAGSVGAASVGIYPITANVEGTGLTNYSIGYSNGALTVNAAGLLVTAADTNKVYGTLLDPAGYTVAGLVNSDTVTNVTLTSAGSGTNASVGGYAISAAGALGIGLTNYTVGYANGTMTVDTAALLITTYATNKIYGTMLNPAAFIVTGLLNSDNVTNVTLASAGSAVTAPVGGYPITATVEGVGLTNYTVGYSNGALMVNAASLLVTTLNSNKVYGTLLNPSGYTVAGLLNDDAVTNVTLTSAGSAVTAPVGGHPITAAVEGVGITNYAIGYSNGTLTVTTANLMVTALNASKTYGVTLNPSGYVVSGLLNSDSVTSVTLTSAGGAPLAALGTYPISADGALGIGLTNYTIGYANGTLTVNVAGLVIMATSTNKIYGTALTPTGYIVAGLMNSDSVTNVTLTSAGGGTNAPAGIHPISAGGALGTGLTNYLIGYIPGTLTVDPANLLVTTHDTNKIYGTTLTPVAYTVTGLLNSDSVTNVVLGSAGSAVGAPVGAHPITATPAGIGLTNYTIGYSNGTLTVNAAGLLITAADTNKVYGTTLAPTGYTVTGLLNSDSVTNVTLTSAGSGTNAPVGSHPISAGAALGIGLTNYAIGYSNGTLTVNVASLLVTTHDTNKVYGATLNPSAFTVSGLMNSDSVTNVTLSSAGSVSNVVVGGYPIAASVEGLGLTNYSIGYSNGTLTVDAAGLLITAGSTNKTYGVNHTFAGTEFSVNGLLFSDTVTNATLASSGAASNAPAGSYAIMPGEAQGAGLGNYSLTYSNGTMTVTPALVTITASNTNKIYGGSISFMGMEFTASGLLNGDTVTNVVLSSAGAASNAPSASYPIVAGGATGPGLSNYFAFYNFGTLVVSKANMSVTVNSTNKTYGSDYAFAGTEFAAAGLLNGDTITNLTLASTGSATNAPVGSYTITGINAQGVGASNYLIFINYGTMTVTPATLTVTANSTGKTVGSTVNFAGTEFGVTGLVNSDTVTSAMLASAGAPAGASTGTYPIIVSNAAGGGLANYSIGYVAGVLTVTNSGLFEITSIQAANGVATITWNSASNQLYQLQYNDDLATTNWTDVVPAVLADGDTTSTTNAVGGVVNRFFRVWRSE